MGEKTSLVRPDGSVINASAEDAETLKALGYREESTEETYSRNVAIGTEDHYTTGTQRLKTFAEGAASGATLGISDLAEEALGWDNSERAAYNPGTRLAGEITGSIAPALFSGGESLAARALEMTPAGQLARGAEAVAGSLGTGRAATAAVRGAVEGAGYGGAAAVTNAQLTGDPLSAESVIAGIGWGALWGGGLGYGASKAGAKLESIVAERAAVKEGLTAEHAIIPDEHWGSFRASVDEAKRVAKETVETVSERVKSSKLAEAPEVLQERVIQAHSAAEGAQKSFLNEVSAAGKMPAEGVRAARDQVMKTFKRATIAAADGNYAKFETLLVEHGEQMGALAKHVGMTAPEIEPFLLHAADTSKQAMEGVRDLSAVREALGRFPLTSAGFAATSPGKMEKHLAAVEKLMGGAGGAEMEGIRSAVRNSIGKMAESMGVAVDGNPATQLKGLWEAARATKTSAGRNAASSFVDRTAHSVGGRVASDAARSVGAGIIGKSLAYNAGSALLGGLVGLKSAVTGAVSNAVLSWAPGVAKLGGKINAAARVEPLRIRLDGTVDEGNKTRRELMKARSSEIRNAGPVVRDTLYRSIEPLSGQHPEFAAQAHAAAVKQFDALATRLPRDPGTAFARLKTMWEPDSVATERFARAYEVFQNPVSVVVKALSTGKVTQEAATALREMNPELFQHMRVGMLERLSQPGVLEKMSYQDQIHIGQLLDLPIHSSQSPRFIAAQQQMYQERSQPLQQQPSTSMSNPGGRPPAGSTTAQRITEH